MRTMIIRLIRIFAPVILLLAALVYGVGRFEVIGIVPANHLTLVAAHASVWIGHAAGAIWSALRRILHV